MKTLIVAPNWIGDALMAQPLLTLLKRADPQQTIVALAPRWVAPVLDAMPEVDETIATDLAHGALQWSARRAFARQIAARRFDRAFVLPNSFKSALIPWLARIPRRVGHLGESRYGLVNARPPVTIEGLAMRERYARLAGVVGVDLPGVPPTLPTLAVLPTPRLVVDAASIEAVRARFGLGASDPLIALCPGAEYGPAKRWPVEHFATLATRLLDERPAARVMLLGGPGDRADCARIVAAIGRGADGGRSSVASSGASSAAVSGHDAARARVHDLAGRTSLAEAIALIAAASSVVSNDSGLMHVAAALSRPQVALFGSSDPRHTPPLSARAHVLWLHLDCSPCFERTCPLGHLNCLVGIGPDRVIDSLQNAGLETR